MFKKLFGPTPLQQWWSSLPSSTKEYLKRQPLWHDKDLYKAVVLGIVIGLVVGFVWGYEVGLPDFSNMPLTYIRG